MAFQVITVEPSEAYSLEYINEMINAFILQMLRSKMTAIKSLSSKSQAEIDF